jgi:acetyl esterase/lipase
VPAGSGAPSNCRNARIMTTPWAKIAVWILGIVAVLAVSVDVAFRVSPWPSVLLIRHAFEKDAIAASRALEKHVPAGVTGLLNEHYDAKDGDAYLDVFFPSDIADSARSLPTVVWVHGGGWVSGSKNQIANYIKILAGKGYTAVGVDYSLAPGSIFPTPIRQVNAALSYLDKNATRLHVDRSRVVLAGDSAGAQIAAAVANVIAVPSYAKALNIIPSIRRAQVVGMLLYCGGYSLDGIDLNGPFGNFMKTVLWSYSGGKDFTTNAGFAPAWVTKYLTAAFPPTFISAGNADPLLAQSVAFADTLSGHGVRVERLFFAKRHKPPVPHEYQFNLDNAAGKLALDRSVAFLAALH